MRGVFMGTTQVPTERTAAEVTSILVRSGASRIMTEFDNGLAVGISFGLTVNGGHAHYRLPVRIEPVAQLLKKHGFKRRKSVDLPTQAARTAWRQILRWVEAQMAMIETGMVSVEEIFMPYAQCKNGQTVFEVFKSNPSRMLGMEPTK